VDVDISTPYGCAVLLDRHGARSYPGIDEREIDGWVVRLSGGGTSRCNSVWPRRDGGALDLAERVQQVEEHYRQAGRPTLFQITPASEPAGLDDYLAGRGYVRHRAAFVQVRDVAGLTGPAAADVRIDSVGSPDWWLLWSAADALDPSEVERSRLVFAKAAGHSGYAVSYDGDEPVAVARGVADEGWLGIFNVATDPAARRRGHARALVGALAGWAAGLGVTGSYVQVMPDNAAAAAVWTRLGFESRYGYWYRMRER
jgi:ribosomal protein S18 acetylase RimI-like enzyme